MKEQAIVMFTGAGSFTLIGLLVKTAEEAAHEHFVRFVVMLLLIGLIYTFAKHSGWPVEAPH